MTKNSYDRRFLLSYYEKIINRASRTLPVKDYKLYEAGLILRHDVDFSIDMAYEFSRIEKKQNICSTYNILTKSELYNPFSISSKNIINEMISDGFEIGLHFDPTTYGEISDKELENKFNEEVQLLESSFNIKIESYSAHNPSLSGKYLNYRGLINAYNSDIFTDNNYISDSMFSFRNKDPMEFVEKSKSQLVQYLTHPVHYFSNGDTSYKKAINLIVNNYIYKLDSILQVNTIYRNERDKITIHFDALDHL